MYFVMSVLINGKHFTRQNLIDLKNKNHEQSTLKSGNSVKLQMCKYCRPKFFFFHQNTNDSYTQRGICSWNEKGTFSS